MQDLGSIFYKTYVLARPIVVRDHLNGHNSLNGHILSFLRPIRPIRPLRRLGRLLIATISSVTIVSTVTTERSGYQQGRINNGRSPQNCIERGCVSVRPSDAILRDDELISFVHHKQNKDLCEVSADCCPLIPPHLSAKKNPRPSGEGLG